MATSPIGTRKKQRPSGEDGKGIWSSLLDSVASGKRLAEKNLLVLGGTTDSQKEFLDALGEENGQQRQRNDRYSTNKKPDIANRFALGYTYQDILDADHDDILARVSIYLLANRHPAFAKLLNPLFTPHTVKDMLVVVLLNWEDPWSWMRTLRDWIRTLRQVVDGADAETKEAMEECMQEWRERRKTTGTAENTSDNDVVLPLGPGEWDEALGVPVCVVCQHAEKIEILEREHGWKDDEFDQVLQYLRTVLAKHGGSIIYTASSAPGQLQTLVRSMLDVESLLQKNPLQHNVIDRDKIFVPPNWDSWGKIRILKEGFDVEAVSEAWSVEIQEPVKAPPINGHTNGDSGTNGNIEHETEEEIDNSTVVAYERVIKDPSHRSSEEANGTNGENNNKLEIECMPTQDFLAQQHQVLEKLKTEDEQARKTKESATPGSGTQTPASRDDAGRVSEHIGPVQFNVGGIQVDADDMLKSLKDRESQRSESQERSFSPAPDGKLENEKLNAFFAGLMSRGGNSASSSPKHP